MRVHRLGAVIEHHAQLKLAMGEVDIACTQHVVAQALHHLVADQAARIGAFGQVMQIGPKVVDHVLLTEPDVGIRVVHEVAQATHTTRINQHPIRPLKFT